MSVSKRKVASRMLTVLVLGAVAYFVIVYFLLSNIDKPKRPLDDYQKTSVDNTANFNLTEPHTQCQYVYDSVNKTVSQAKGFEHCPLPILN